MAGRMADRPEIIIKPT